MFDKLAKPERVGVTMDNGELCFYVYFAHQHAVDNNKSAYTEKQLDAIARELFDIEQFDKKQPEFKGMWKLVEDGRSYVLKFYPFKSKRANDSMNLHEVLELLYGKHAR